MSAAAVESERGGSMIPTMILFRALFGRWPGAALVAAAIAWPILLVVTGVMDVEGGLLAAAGLSAANAVVGVVVHQGTLFGVRRLRRQAGAA